MENHFEIFEIKEQVLADNEKAAGENRRMLSESGTFLLNLMGSPGAGKTSTVLEIIRRLGGKYRIGVMEADADGDTDAKTVAATGTKVIQIHTGGLCHMDADMTRRGLQALGIGDLDLVILENVGNLVCPAEFEVGADLRVMILSVPEGDDKPLKYPLMFQISDCMLISKTDTAAVFDFDEEAATKRAKALNPTLSVFPVSSRNGSGYAEFCSWLDRQISEELSGKDGSAPAGKKGGASS